MLASLAAGSYSGLSTQYRAAVVAVGKGDKYAETEEDMLESGIQRNPYLGWEYGDALKREGRDFSAAFKVRMERASEASRRKGV